MASTDILSAIRGGEADPSELETLLLSHYHQSSHPADRTVLYGEAPALELKIAKSGRITSLIPQAYFIESDVAVLRQLVEDHILTPGPTKIGRRVMFAAVPVRGWFRFRDDFQILPVPENAPRPDGWSMSHPFLLEASFPSSPDANINMMRRGKREREFELLCSALLHPMPQAQTQAAEFHWVYEPMVDNELTSTQRQGGYSWPGANFQGDAFSDVSALPQLPQVDVQTYYGSRRRNGELDAPETFQQSLEVVAGLSAEDRRRYLRACFWYQQSWKAQSVSGSMFVVAIVSAVEALMPDPVAGPPCPTCKRRHGVGPTKQFEAFVDRAAPSLQQDDRRRFYNLRSAISHGGKLLHTDEMGWGVGSAQASEWQELEQLRNIVRVVLYNWLHYPAIR